MAASAVNQVLNYRMSKRQQMRWSPRGAHLLAQVRCAVINGDLSKRLALFRQRMNALPTEVATFLSQLQRVEASLHQGF
jgi:CHASE2 domain-containing sensor protein